MYAQLTEALTRRFTKELRDYWARHPKYPNLPEFIQGKYSFKERPQESITVKVSSASNQPLSWDNYKGVVKSYVHLTKVPGKDGLAIEWVREDAQAIRRNGGRFPSLPGVYYIDIQQQDGEIVFWVDSLVAANAERLVLNDQNVAHLAHEPRPGSVRLTEEPNAYLLTEGQDYTVTGASVALAAPPLGSRYVVASYKYEGETKGPFPLYEMQANNQAIPGVVLAFGRQVSVGDQMAVVVYPERELAALEYGGWWELSVDCDVIARDVHDQREIADQSVMYLWYVVRPKLSTEGLEITSVSIGGESEETYNDTEDTYYFNGSFSVTCQTECAVFVPLDVYLRNVSPVPREAVGIEGEVQNRIQLLSSLNLIPAGEAEQRVLWGQRETIT